MLKASKPIGVMDSGVGGLTVVRELQRLCPEENIIYFGDSANCPYGNRTQEDIADLSHRVLRFMQEQEVKIVAIACNTISTIVELLSAGYDFPIIGIVAPTAKAVAEQGGIKRVGVFATNFTVSTRNYDNLIAAHNPEVEVRGKGSPNLAALVDRGDFDEAAIAEEIQTHLGALLAEFPVEQVILGCTHFPIVVEAFEAQFPGVEYINPAVKQAEAVVEMLGGMGLCNSEGEGRLHINTSGDPEVFNKMAARLGLVHIESITQQDPCKV